MPIYQINNNSLQELPTTTFPRENLLERSDLQRLLKTNIRIIAPDVLVVAEEFGEWEDSKRQIDLLGVDKTANLVVIELKRTEDGSHMELQAIRYAAMISSLSWNQVISTYQHFLVKNNINLDAEESLLEFLGWSQPSDDFGQSVRIILASANFSKEITTTVMWLNDHELDITCIRLSLYRLDDKIIISADQIIPLPEAESYQIQLKQKRSEERIAKTNSKDRSSFSISYAGREYKSNFRKADIGFFTIKLLEAEGLLNKKLFDFLREDTSCNLRLLKTIEEMNDNEKLYGKYRYNSPPDINYEGKDYYIARNWGINNVQKFIEKMVEKIPSLRYSSSNCI